MGETGRQHVETYYSRERVSGLYDALIRRLVSASPTAGEAVHQDRRGQ
jgi:hypothetical protein